MRDKGNFLICVFFKTTYYQPFLPTLKVKLAMPHLASVHGLTDHFCPACRRFFSTIRGMHSHLSTARSCQWYRKGKLKQLDLDPFDSSALSMDRGLQDSMELDLVPVQENQERATLDLGPGDENLEPIDFVPLSQEKATFDLETGDEDVEPIEFVPLNQERAPLDLENGDEDLEPIDFVPLIHSHQQEELEASGSPGPSRIRFEINDHRTSQDLENAAGTLVVEEYPEAGKVVKIDEGLYVRWKKQFGEQNLRKDGDGDVVMDDGNAGQTEAPSLNAFAPFASELDWRVALWAVKDGIGHQSFDRLLAIPGVCLQHLCLKFF